MLVTDQPENIATTNELDKVDKPTQAALIDAAFVQFNGNSGEMIDGPPKLDDARTYIVKATCIEVKHKRRKDNEERVTVVMEIDSCYERGKVPIVDENQGALVDEDGQPTDEATGDEAGADQ